MLKISVISASNREDGLDIVAKSLAKQTFRDFEWIVCAPVNKKYLGITHGYIPEPKKGKEDFYNLNKAWNALINKSQGELIVSIVDYTEFLPNILEILWTHYITNPTTCISGVGYQFDGDKLVWQDLRIQHKTLYPIAPVDMELRLASIPKRAIQAVGGFDEEYDKVVANSEKEIAFRIFSLGYLFLIDERVTYKFAKHEPHGKKWDELYKKSCALLNHDLNEIKAGHKLKLDFVDQ